MNKEDWLAEWISKGGNPDVLQFIADIAFFCRDSDNAIDTLFRAGYCYYFAAMLRIAFHRGQICHAYPNSHIVWVDDDSIAYDITGICMDYGELIPITGYSSALNGFRHVPGEQVLGNEESRRIVEDIRSKTTINEFGVRRYELGEVLSLRVPHN